MLISLISGQCIMWDRKLKKLLKVLEVLVVPTYVVGNTDRQEKLEGAENNWVGEYVK